MTAPEKSVLGQAAGRAVLRSLLSTCLEFGREADDDIDSLVISSMPGANDRKRDQDGLIVESLIYQIHQLLTSTQPIHVLL